MRVLLLITVCVFIAGCSCDRKSRTNTRTYTQPLFYDDTWGQKVDADTTFTIFGDFIPSEWISDTVLIGRIENSVRENTKRSSVRTVIYSIVNEKGCDCFRDFKKETYYLPNILLAGKTVALPQLITAATFDNGDAITGEDFHTIFKLVSPDMHEVMTGHEAERFIIEGGSIYDINRYKMHLIGRIKTPGSFSAIIVKLVCGFSDGIISKDVVKHTDVAKTFLIILKGNRALYSFIMSELHDTEEYTCYVAPDNLFIVQNITLHYIDTPPDIVVGYYIYQIGVDGYVRPLKSPDELRNIN